MDMNLPVFAGAVSTIIFGLSTLPMLRKAFHTKDLQSYSLGNILLANGGNVVHSVYVFNLPPGPIWLLHSFYLVTTGLMLFWYLRYEWRPHRSNRLTLRGFPRLSSLTVSSHDPDPNTSTGPMSPHAIEIPRSPTPSGA